MSLNTRQLINNIAELIAIPSISSTIPDLDMSNLGVIHWLAERLSRIGFKIEILPLPNKPLKANLIATMGEGDGGLVLAGHTDTVPIDEKGWNSDPFKLNVLSDQLVGLGTADMKSFFAIILSALEQIELTKITQPLIILATADEETTMAGARALVDLGRPKARYAVIGEPTNMKPIHTHKGMMMESICVHGVAGHSSDPANGVNALTGMHLVISELTRWQQELKKMPNPEFPVNFATINLGYINGGDNPNRICERCELHFDIRLLPGMASSAIQHELTQRIAACLQNHHVQSWELNALKPATEPMLTPRTSHIVQTAEKLTGFRSEAANFCTEGSYLNALGMETLILGPGNIEVAHQNNEYLSLTAAATMVEILTSLIALYCCRRNLWLTNNKNRKPC